MSESNLSAGLQAAKAVWAKEAAERAARDPLPATRVLVWGPSLEPSSNPAHRPLQRKRREIVERIASLGLVAATSEDLIEGEPNTYVPINHLERHQAELADLIIVLLASEGTISELSSVLSSRRLLRRAVLFVEAGRFSGSFVGDGPLVNAKGEGAVHIYTADELKSCHVAGAAVNYALDVAESLRGTSE